MSNNKQQPPKTILIGAIAGAFGANGEIKLKSFTADPAACLSYAPFMDEAGEVILQITKSRPIKGGFAVRSPDVRYRDQAEALRGTQLYCLRDDLTPTEEDEFYHSDLIGLVVVSTDKQLLGKIKDVHNYGASDLLEIVDTPNIQASWNIPFTLAHVPEIDLELGHIILADWSDYLPEVKPDSKGEKKHG